VPQQKRTAVDKTCWPHQDQLSIIVECVGDPESIIFGVVVYVVAAKMNAV
jgi:hypothetical protein